MGIRPTSKTIRVKFKSDRNKLLDPSYFNLDSFKALALQPAQISQQKQSDPPPIHLNRRGVAGWIGGSYLARLPNFRGYYSPRVTPTLPGHGRALQEKYLQGSPSAESPPKKSQKNGDCQFTVTCRNCIICDRKEVVHVERISQAEVFADATVRDVRENVPSVSERRQTLLAQVQEG